MRLFIGGVEQVYPARWFFCDPNAELFPNPHGAEAAPWLKQYERNEEWGDDGTLKKIDRGINPGYPGSCFVGDPAWFLDGQLPADFLAGPQRITPACCGYTPPFNPDPRCPPWRETVPCPLCSEGFGWDTYTFTATGGTGDFEYLNGTQTVHRTATCRWDESFGYKAIFTLNNVLSGATLSLGIFPGIGSCSYRIPPPVSCLVPHNGLVSEFQIGVGTTPTIDIS